MEGYYEQLKHRIEELKADSQDPLFTDYLQKLNNRLIQEKYQLDLIKSELDRSYQLYLKRISQETVRVNVNEGQVVEAVNIEPQPKKKKDKEFAIGIGLFSVIGIFFVLAAFVMLGMYFMNGFVKGMIMYVIAAVVWLVSELLVRRKNQTLSLILSAIGIAGLYIATIVNYLFLYNFNEPVACILLIAITWLVFLVNRRKTLGIIQMASVGISTMVLMLNNSVPEGGDFATQEIYLIVYFAASMLLIEGILYKLSKVREKNTGLVSVYGISMAICTFSCLGVLESNSEHFAVLKAIIMTAVVVMSVLFFLLMRKQEIKWTQLYFACGMALLLYVFREACPEAAAALIAMLLLVKLLPKDLPVKICNAGITTIAAVFVCGAIENARIEAYLVLGALILSVLLIRYWQTYFETIITFAAVLFIIMVVDNALMLPIAVAVLWLAVVLFNQIERFRGKTIEVYNIMVLVCVAGCYLSLIFNSYEELRIVYFILTVLGAGIIAFVFQEKNKLGTKCKGIVMAGFLTYMILVSRFTFDITASVLLMIVGVGSIGAGFYLADKKLRIYGLVVAMVVCFKIALFDFRGEDMLQKMLLFFVAGVVSLVISGIYVLLDKRYHN